MCETIWDVAVRENWYAKRNKKVMNMTDIAWDRIDNNKDPLGQKDVA